MHLSLFVSLLVAVSAAPHTHNAHQNRVIRRRAGPLLHADMLALYNAAQVTSTTTDATATATEITAHGPYAAGKAHGGNVNAAKAAVAVTATADTATATDTTDSSNAWITAAAPRNTTMYSHSTDSNDNSDDETDDNAEADNSDAVTVIEMTSDKKSSNGVPGWAIALTIVLILGSLGGVATLLYLKARRTRHDNETTEKAGKPSKTEPEDALSSYKAFWELKRRSAGSFVSADASPEALASDLNNNHSRPVSHSSNASLPMYEPHETRAPEFAVTSPVDTPLNEEAPPRGFLYQ